MFSAMTEPQWLTTLMVGYAVAMLAMLAIGAFALRWVDRKDMP